MTVLIDDGGMNCVVRGRHGVFIYNRHDVYIGRSLQEYGEFSEREGEFLRQLCRPGDVVVEVGANIGTHTVPLARQIGPSGMIFAFEPQPVVFQTLCANVALNSLTNVECCAVAVGDHSGDIGIPPIRYDSEENFGGISLSPDAAGRRVSLVRLDDVLELSKLRLLKIDVEGMEQPVLEGARETIGRLRPALYVENDRLDRSPELIETIQQLGYDLYWHCPPFFNPQNFAGNPQDVFGNIVSVNMLGVPSERQSEITGLVPVTDATSHPLKPAA